EAADVIFRHSEARPKPALPKAHSVRVGAEPYDPGPRISGAHENDPASAVGPGKPPAGPLGRHSTGDFCNAAQRNRNVLATALFPSSEDTSKFPRRSPAFGATIGTSHTRFPNPPR